MKPYYETELGKLYHGDCLDIMPHLEPVDLVLTDPPYFLPAKTHCGTRAEGSYKRTLADTSILTGYFSNFFNLLEGIIKETGSYYIFCDAQSYYSFYQALYPHTKYVRLIIWDKIISFNGYTWRHQHELIAWGEKDKSPRIPTGDGDVLKYRAVLQKDREHPAQKPVGLLVNLLNKSSGGDVVLDLFLGSGTTAIACEQLNRRWIGIEIEEKYCEIAAKRIENERKQLKLF